MRAAIAVASAILIVAILQDAFETIVLPRRVTRRFRMARFFYRAAWIPSAALARRIASEKRRETYLGFFGPLSLILLLSLWAAGLVTGFAVLLWSIGTPIHGPDSGEGFATYLYLSGTTFFTLGYGDVTPRETAGRVVAVVEAGTGFGLLALIMGYLPVIYQAFSRREAAISLLDARAGSPPSAAELLRRHSGSPDDLNRVLHDWERWAADLLESHISYPVLCYYRSQHNNQSWLTSLTAILDASALVIVGIEGTSKRQAELTLAMARHAVVDLAQIFDTPPREPVPDRLPPDELTRLRAFLNSASVRPAEGDSADSQLRALRRVYEPYVKPLSDFLLLPLPRWSPEVDAVDNWQTSAWGRITGGVDRTSIARSHRDGHF
jgi:voltage-gated potassium channel Kch